MIEIRDSEASLTDADICNVEKKIGILFPAEYRNFLLLNNGGRPSKTLFAFRKADGHSSESCVDWFLAIYDGKYDNFESYYATYKINQARIPFHLVPIAHDPGGNLICISVSGSDCGAVFFWDHENEAPGVQAPSYDNVYLIEDSFNRFLHSLC